MFCSKCGTQLPDGAMFCTSCGNQLNIQPTAPMMPVEPVAPVMETPVMDAPVMDAPVMDAPVMDAPVMDTPVMDAPVMDAPVMDSPVMDAPVMDAPVMDAPVMDAPVMDTPIMPGFQPTMNPVDSQNPYNAPYNNMPYNNIPGNAPMNPAPKKSKAPLFIGLGIAGLVITIIAIVLILLLTGDDKKKDSKKTPSTTKAEVTTKEATTEEPTTEEPITEEPTTEVVVVPDVDYEDAETIVIKFMNALNSANYSKAAKYILPVMDDVLNEENGSAELLAESLASYFQDPYGEFLDYNVYAVFVDDSDKFDEYLDEAFDEGYDLESYPSYETPTHFAGAEIEFSYEDQTSYIYIYLAYADGEFYIYDFNDENFYIDFEEESTSDETGEFDFNTSLEQNFNDVEVEIEGTVKQLDGHTVTIPDTWIVTDSNCISPDGKNAVTFSAPQPISSDTKLFMLETLCETYINMGFENLKFGNLVANGKTGYFIEGDLSGVYTYIFMFLNPTEDKLFLSVITSEDVDSDDYMDALGIAASLEIQ